MHKRNKRTRSSAVAIIGAMGALAGSAGVEAAVLERLGLYAAPADGINAPFALASSAVAVKRVVASLRRVYERGPVYLPAAHTVSSPIATRPA